MSQLRSVLFGAAAFVGASMAFVLPAQADAGFYIGPDGARIYYNDDEYDAYRSCHNEVWYTRRDGDRMRVVDRICYTRWGDRVVVDRAYYPVDGWDW